MLPGKHNKRERNKRGNLQTSYSVSLSYYITSVVTKINRFKTLSLFQKYSERATIQVILQVIL